ncbi:MAG TPA: hypothetical protein VF883_09325 [Thermoanaerobaculia bacterium]|jgi:hypothetical protein
MMRAALSALCALLSVLVSSSAGAAEPLFPTPLHLTRQVHDPLADTTVVLEEYGYGNRLVSVRGAKTSIADYERGELTEIDRDAATYSVTRFDLIARAVAMAGGGGAAPVKEDRAEARATSAMRSTGMRATKLGRNAEYFEAEVGAAGMKQKVEIALDPTARVSKAALEVLLGAAYPAAKRPEHDAVMSAAVTREQRRGNVSTNATAATQELYALPIEQRITIGLDDQTTIELRSSVVRVGIEQPPADLVSIPAGARLVVSRYVAVANELELMNRPSSPVPNVP